MHVEWPTILCFWLLLNLTLLASVAHAQRPVDTAAGIQPTSPLESYAHKRLGADSRLYNGREYIRNGTSAKGFPNFEWDSLLPGSVDYDGIFYQIPLEYDIAQDKLVVRNYADNILISLVGEKTSRFSIGPYTFRFVGPGTDHLPESGFYQELFVGRAVTLLARKHKILVFPTALDQQAQYLQYDTYFLLASGNSYKVIGEKELLDILKDRKDELKKYIRKNHLSFKRNLEKSFIQTIAYYQQLKS
jgi:hypothetical protein